MGKKLVAFIVTFTILAATYGIFFAYFSFNGKQTPKAEGGQLDLTSWRFADDGIVPLDGEWTFYPQRLLSPADFASPPETGSPSPAESVRVPGSWPKKAGTTGMATYRLRIKVADGDSVYGLKTSSIQLANRVYINGKEIGGSGVPAESKSAYRAENRPFVGYFKLQPGWNDLVVQTANFEMPASSGINESVYLGYSGQISRLRDQATTHDWITVVSFLIMGLYFIGLFSQRKRDDSLIFFGMICLFFALFASTRGERVLYILSDSVPFWLFLRIQTLSALGAGLGFFLYLNSAFRTYCTRWLIRVGWAAGTVMIVLSLLFLPQIDTASFRLLTTVYATFPLLYAVYIFVTAAFHKVEGSLNLVVAAIALNAHALIQNSNVYFAVPVYQVPPFEPFLFLLALALLMSLRFSNAYRQIEKLTVQLLKSDKLKDEFLARTSHEFKSPLHGILNIAKSMLGDAEQPPTARQREKLQLITGITGRLSQLVYDILDFSKLKQGELTVDPMPIDLHSVVEMQVRIHSFQCADRDIRLENRVPVHLPYALADESRFSQIMSNLLDNAVRHTASGSIVVTAAENRGKIEISVQDTGEGIDPQDLPHIFDAFKSLDAKMERSGFGLGLSIAKQLVELQHGEIAVTSEKGVGTTFTFTLPVAQHKSRREAANRGSRAGAIEPEYSFPTPYYRDLKGKHTVLIVDDQFPNLKVLIDALEPLGCNVIAVKNGYEALEQLSTSKAIDLVVLDLMMPGISGYEVCQKIRETYTLLDLPVLMVTAAIQPQDKVAAFEAGANDFLTKPFDLAELKARIGSLLALKEALAKAVDLEVAFLQSQIKPHFLFNVLNSIVSLSYTDEERSRKLTMDLADYLRGSFRFSNVESRVPFGEELDLIQTYVEIEKARFKDRIRFEYDISEEAYGANIPPLLLQPLVENAIRHGFADRFEGGTVRMKADAEAGICRFVIEDDGVGIEPGRLKALLETGTEGRQGVGILNINKRLKYEYGTQLQVESVPGRGTRVTVRIPVGSA
ncbi:ATP-binding protein [Cohnella caldifontis]|uniref:hybrid sensor histidine kinase/response regulator n=1 Tax=Cohnella caldifontis TaxID=3027471 RepID=UPI0023EAB59B|nr:ATP-binding protein [Cohnella sp. YIM B05605]